ncbi:MAG TPA: TonB family protein [bacterium]|nr:TonB family protein [bacterium]HPS29741.1 TonB family protein [bacterium]
MNKRGFLSIGILISALIHAFIFASIFHLTRVKLVTENYGKSTFVQVKIKKTEPEIKKEPVKPPVAKKIEIKKPPVSHIRKEPEKDQEAAKPVFGVTKKTVEDKTTEGIGVRVGNTLMKEMEKEYTPPEKVKDYSSGSDLEERAVKKEEKKFAPVASTALAVMPVAINPVKPDYPKALEEEEIEGEVVLELSISKKGDIVNIKVLESDNKLFSEAAVKTVSKYKFRPGKTKDGTPVDAVIEFTISFEMPL